MARASSPAPAPASKAIRAPPPARWANSPCAASRKASRANYSRTTSMSGTSSSMAASGRRAIRAPTSAAPMGCSTPMRSPRPTCSCTASTAAPGPGKSSFGPGSRISEKRPRRPLAPEEIPMTDGAALRTADIGTVEDRFFTIRDFRLANGTVMPEATIAYETYGRLAPPSGSKGGRNAVLLTHGYTSGHHAAGRNPANGNQPGSWDGPVGPGKAIDTDRPFLAASNMLGSSYGSTNAASINPATGAPYGPDFPAITLTDIVSAQKIL